MARNDVYININALSPADAVVTGQQDMTAATVPELVLGDTPTFNFYFTDNTNVWPSWAGNASYSLTWALSDAVAGDFSPAATTGNATPITGGWSVLLPLNSYDLVGLLNTKRVSQPYPVTNLWQQLRVTDPSGNEVTRAMFLTPVRYRAISDTQNTESASPTGGRFVAVNNLNALTTPTSAQFYSANPVPTSALGTASNGELLIGNGTGFTKSTLTAGTGITVTNGSGSITIDASGAQETLTATVKNAESVAITKGQVVYLFGATGGFASVKLAYNTSDATSAKTFGVVSDTSIAANGTGTVTCVGVVDGLNLGAYNDGDTLYLGATPGSVTATKPYAPNHLVYVGIVERANAGNGELYVKVQNGYELDEIHDVQITTPPAAGAVLIRDATNSLWKAARLTAGTNIAITNGDASASIAFSGTLPVASGGTGVTTSTGSGSVVLSTSPSLTTPSLGAATASSINSTTIPSSKTLVVTTDKLSALAATTSSELAGVISDETGTGSLVFANTPTLVTPNIGAATGTSVNLTGAGTFSGNLTVSGTGGITSTAPSPLLRGSTSVLGGVPKLTLENTNIGAWNVYLSGTDGGDFKIDQDSTNKFRMALGTGNATLAGNLTVSGTGTSTFAGNVGITNPANAYTTLTAANTASSSFGLRINAGTNTNDRALTINKADTSTPLFFVNGGGDATLAGNLTVSGGTITGGTSGLSLASGGTNQNITLTPSGTGKVSLGLSSNNVHFSSGAATITPNLVIGANAGKALSLSAGSNGASFSFDSSGYFAIAYDTRANIIANGYGTTEALRVTGSGNLLIGTTTDGGQKLQVSGTAIVSSTAASTSTTTGALVVSGGVGVAGAVNVGGAIAIGNTVQTAASVASTHKVTIVIGGVTYYLLATNV